MYPVKTPDTNAVFVLEGCGDLPATKCHDVNGVPHIQTCWALTPQELETIAKTGRLYVLVMGTGVPPLSLSVESMLEKEGES